MIFKRVMAFSLLLCSSNLDAKNFAELKKIYTDGYEQFIRTMFSPNVTEAKTNQCVPWISRGIKSLSWEDLSEKNRNTVVQFVTYINYYDFVLPYRAPQLDEGCGSGFIISGDGYILTNFHVVAEGIKVVVQLPGLGKERFDIDFIGASPELDIALWKFTEKSLKKIMLQLRVTELNYLELGNSDDIHNAEEIMGLGFPLGQENLKSAIGNVSGREHGLIKGGYAANELIQTTTPTNPGNSGGPVIDKRGLVVGILVASTRNANGIHWFIPINNVIATLKDLDNKLIIRKPWWGLQSIKTNQIMLDYLNAPNDGGIYVTAVGEESLLAQAGICPGDIIYSLFDQKIDWDGCIIAPWTNDKVYFTDILAKIPSGKTVWFDVYRDGKKITVSVIANNRSRRGIDYFFPWYEQNPDYEMIAGIAIVPLSKNLIEIAKTKIESEYLGYLSPYEKIENQNTPCLAVTIALPNSLAALTKSFDLTNDDRIISEVNGSPVKTIDDFRKAVLLSKGKTYLTFKMVGGTFVVFSVKDIIEQEDFLSQTYQFKKSQLIDALVA